MSEIQLIELEGLLSKRQLRALKAKAKQRAAVLKRLRTRNDNLARQLLRTYYVKGKDGKHHWTSKVAQEQFRILMSKRHKLHERISRLSPEPVDPEFDSP